MAKKTVESSAYSFQTSPTRIYIAVLPNKRKLALIRELNFIRVIGGGSMTINHAQALSAESKWTVKEMRTYIKRWEKSKYSDIKEYADMLSKRIKDSQSIGKKKIDVAKSSCHIFIACIDQEKCSDYQKGKTTRCKYASKRDDGCGNTALIAEELISSLKGYTECKVEVVYDKKS